MIAGIMTGIATEIAITTGMTAEVTRPPDVEPAGLHRLTEHAEIETEMALDAGITILTDDLPSQAQPRTAKETVTETETAIVVLVVETEIETVMMVLVVLAAAAATAAGMTMVPIHLRAMKSCSRE